MALELRTRLRSIVVDLRRDYYRFVKQMHISKTARISWHIFLDKAYPKGIYIDDESYLASGVQSWLMTLHASPAGLTQRLVSVVLLVLMPLSCQVSLLAMKL